MFVQYGRRSLGTGRDNHTHTHTHVFSLAFEIARPLTAAKCSECKAELETKIAKSWYENLYQSVAPFQAER